MKKLNSLLALAAAISMLLFTACEDEEPALYNAGDVFHFASGSSSINEDDINAIAIPVIFTKTGGQSGSVSFSISGEGIQENVDYEVLNTESTLSFGADDYQDTIFIRPIDDNDLGEGKVLTITLSGGTEPVGFPGPDGLLSTHTLTIIDDDCPAPLEGTYNQTTIGAQGDGSGGAVQNPPINFGNPTTPSITAIGCDLYVISDITGGLYDIYTAGNFNPATFEVNGTSITIIEAESPDVIYGGDAFFGNGSFELDGNGEVVSITLMWSNSYGDQGTTTLTPM